VYRPKLALAPFALRAPNSASPSAPFKNGHCVHFQSSVSGVDVLAAGVSATAVIAASAAASANVSDA
jgi:hypothetical protein